MVGLCSICFRSKAKTSDAKGMPTDSNPAYGQMDVIKGNVSTDGNPVYEEMEVRGQQVNGYELCDLPSSQPQEPIYDN